jgi:hypothetical protein
MIAMAERDGSRSRKVATKKATTKSTTGSASRTTTQPATKSTTKRSASAKAAAPRRPRAEAKLGAPQVASRAAQQLLELTGRESEGVTGLSRTDDGWAVQVEVIEARRIPDTTDVLALYEIQVNDEADLIGYHRVRRYVRGKPGED